MTQEEEKIIYEILFEGRSEDDVTSAIYEVYDTLNELIKNRKPLKQETIH